MCVLFLETEVIGRREYYFTFVLKTTWTFYRALRFVKWKELLLLLLRRPRALSRVTGQSPPTTHLTHFVTHQTTTTTQANNEQQVFPHSSPSPSSSPLRLPPALLARFTSPPPSSPRARTLPTAHYFGEEEGASHGMRAIVGARQE
jgi:hypothetical protein